MVPAAEAEPRRQAIATPIPNLPLPLILPLPLLLPLNLTPNPSPNPTPAPTLYQAIAALAAALRERCEREGRPCVAVSKASPRWPGCQRGLRG